MLSVTAGCTDIIGFLGLNRLCTAHITGNLVILAAHIVAGGEAQVAKMLSVPVFIVMVGLTVLLAGGLASIGLASLCPLLLLHSSLLAGFLIICVAAGPRIDPNATDGILAGMLKTRSPTDTRPIRPSILDFLANYRDLQDLDKASSAGSLCDHTGDAHQEAKYERFRAAV